MTRRLPLLAAALACACTAEPPGAALSAEAVRALAEPPAGGLAAFLPPLAPGPGPGLRNTAGLAPALEIAPLAPGAGAAESFTTGAGSRGLREAGGHYHLDWDTSGAVVGTTYRLRVLLDGRELGATQVRVVAPRGGGRGDREPTAVVRGSTVPVRFLVACGPDRCAAPRPALERVSVDSRGAEGDGPSSAPAVSQDGRIVAFSSDATNLVAADLGQLRDVFVRDRALGTTERASVATDGTGADGDSFLPAVSGDGSRVAFMTRARNLGGLDFGGRSPSTIYLRDRARGTTGPVSVGEGGLAPHGDSAHPAISADGRLVAFTSAAWDLVPGDGNFAEDVFLRDLEAGATTRVSLAPGGAEADGPSGEPSLSADGRFVAFASLAANLVDGDTNGDWDVFVHDRATGELSRASVATGGGQASGMSRTPRLSGDGRIVAFESTAPDLAPGDDNGTWDVFVHDREGGTTTCLTCGRGGTSGRPALSADGRRVAFQSTSADLVPGDANGVSDVFWVDLPGGAIARASVDAGGREVAGASSGPALSGDGALACFGSESDALVPDDRNGVRDLFARALPVP